MSGCDIFAFEVAQLDCSSKYYHLGGSAAVNSKELIYFGPDLLPSKRIVLCQVQVVLYQLNQQQECLSDLVGPLLYDDLIPDYSKVANQLFAL